MKILCLCYEYPPVGGGGAVVCEGISEALAVAGHEIDVVTSGMQDLLSFEEVRGVRVHRVSCRRPHRHYTTTLQMTTLLRPLYRKALELYWEHRHEVAHCHFVMPTGLVAYQLHKKIGLPYLLTAHGSDVPGYNPDRFKWIHPLILPMWRRVIRASTCLTTPSNFLKSLIQRHINTRVIVVPNGFDSPRYPEGDGRDNRILIATRLFERKGVQFAIRALEGLDTDWEFCVAGDGPYRSVLENLADERGVKVRFLGFVDRTELQKLYHSTKVFVFTSSQENFPIVLLEAMAAGCAVITSSAPGCMEVVGDAALSVTAEDAGLLHEALKLLLQDIKEIERLGCKARDRAAEFTWSTLAERYESLLKRR